MSVLHRRRSQRGHVVADKIHPSHWLISTQVEVRNGQRSEGAGDPLRQTASLKARIAANPWDGWRLRVEPTTSIPPDLFAPKEVLTF